MTLEVEQRTKAVIQQQTDLEEKLKESNDRNSMLMAQLVQYKRDNDQHKSMRVVSNDNETDLLAQTDAALL